MAAFAGGRSRIANALAARETRMMIDALATLGVTVAIQGADIIVDGIGLERGSPLEAGAVRPIWASGSALVGRLFTVIGAARAETVLVDGNSNLRSRPFRPLFEALAARGVDLRFADNPGSLPVTVLSNRLPGGTYRLSTDISSQFASALLIASPFADEPLSVVLEGPLYSLAYIEQTIAMMRRFGVDPRVSDDHRRIDVVAGARYLPADLVMTGDYTSVSYILGAAFVTRGAIEVDGLDPASLQGERAIVEIFEAMGARVRWLTARNLLSFDCTGLPDEIDAAFDLRNCPNILPTVAAVAATIKGRVRITGGRLTQLHKSPRISAIGQELRKLGVPVTWIEGTDGSIDGLEIRGRTGALAGGAELSGHGDHRIYMALRLTELACLEPCRFAGHTGTADSFPDFESMLDGTRAPFAITPERFQTRTEIVDDRLFVAI